MAIDNQFRIDELISKGSRAIVSKDEVTGNHTFTVGSKEIVNTPYPHIKGERDGELTGRIEKPKYNEEELVKAVDTVVDELILPPKKEQPDVVPKQLYDDLRRLYDERGVRINELEAKVLELESIIAELRALIESLQIELDAAKLQQTVAENQSQQINEQYVALLQDFSQAVIKSTKEGIERVSLKAQTEGLIAQKESLRNQIQALNNIVKALQGQIAVQQQQIEAQNIRQASESALDGQAGSFDEIGNVGYKIPQGEFNDTTKQLFIKTENDNRINVLQGTGLNLFNFNEEPVTFTLSTSGDATKFLQVPGSITLPGRVDAKPGVGHVTFRWSPLGSTSPRKATISGTVNINASSGESFSVKADYFKEVRRKDTWSARGSARAVVGSEL
jgi:hypothetical protein